MARTKATWYMKIVGLAWGLPNFESMQYEVSIPLALDREPDRPIYIRLTPDAADRLADDLIAYARAAREQTERLSKKK